MAACGGLRGFLCCSRRGKARLNEEGQLVPGQTSEGCNLHVQCVAASKIMCSCCCCLARTACQACMHVMKHGTIQLRGAPAGSAIQKCRAVAMLHITSTAAATYRQLTPATMPVHDLCAACRRCSSSRAFAMTAAASSTACSQRHAW